MTGALWTATLRFSRYELHWCWNPVRHALRHRIAHDVYRQAATRWPAYTWYWQSLIGAKYRIWELGPLVIREYP